MTSTNHDAVSLSLVAHSAAYWSSASTAANGCQCKQQELNWFRSDFAAESYRKRNINVLWDYVQIIY